jgi:hypothetical protein
MVALNATSVHLRHLGSRKHGQTDITDSGASQPILRLTGRVCRRIEPCFVTLDYRTHAVLFGYLCPPGCLCARHRGECRARATVSWTAQKVVMNRQMWVWVMIFMIITGGATAGAGHNSGPNPRPPTVCVE